MNNNIQYELRRAARAIERARAALIDAEAPKAPQNATETAKTDKYAKAWANLPMLADWVWRTPLPLGRYTISRLTPAQLHSREQFLRGCKGRLSQNDRWAELDQIARLK